TTAVDTYTVCDPNSYATGFFMWRDERGMLELQLRCAEYVPGICEPPGLGSGEEEGVGEGGSDESEDVGDGGGPAPTTPSPSQQRNATNDDDDSDWPPSWWIETGGSAGTALLVGVTLAALIAAVL
ncbi:unnamed protein product, partial [Ectocarpus sp. 12 AP-2014]